MKKIFAVLLVIASILAAFCAAGAEDIVILYTNDVHGALENYIDVAAAKSDFETVTPYVALVDAGDHIQGEAKVAITRGENAIASMNLVGYDYAILGNHEFDYQLSRMKELAGLAQYEYLGCNINYTGKGENMMDFLKPYAIKEFGETKVAFIGVSTPESIRTSTPIYFQEDGEYVYNFSEGEKGRILYDRVQQTIDAAIADGAEFVILLTHLGLEEAAEPYRSIDLIANTHGVDAVIDGHSHSVVPMQTVFNAEGNQVILTQTGTKLANLGVLVITDSGNIFTTLVNGEHYDAPEEILKGAEAIAAETEAKLGEVVGTSNTPLMIQDENGIRTVRCRETNIGDFAADAYRFIGEAEIGIINGGCIRANLPVGDITIQDLLSVHPFGNTLAISSVKGSTLLELLEWTTRNVQAKSNDGNGNAVGENGGFLQVSGLKFTVDTSIESPCIADEQGMYFGMIEGAPTRVSDVQVELDGQWVPLDPEREYKVASANYILLQSGDGASMLQNSTCLLETQIPDYGVIITYLTDVLNGDLSRYAEIGDRITIK